MADINNTVRAELSNNLRELTRGQQQQWHDSIWPHLSESLPDGRLSVNRALPKEGRRRRRRVGRTDEGREGQETEERSAECMKL